MGSRGLTFSLILASASAMATDAAKKEKFSQNLLISLPESVCHASWGKVVWRNLDQFICALPQLHRYIHTQRGFKFPMLETWTCHS